MCIYTAHNCYTSSEWHVQYIMLVHLEKNYSQVLLICKGKEIKYPKIYLSLLLVAHMVPLFKINTIYVDLWKSLMFSYSQNRDKSQWLNKQTDVTYSPLVPQSVIVRIIS